MPESFGNLPQYTDAPKPPRAGRIPAPFISLGLIGVFASWIPLALFARARATYSSEPRVSLMQDMGVQPKYREQQSSEVFADGRADRPQIIGTVARGHLEADDNYYRGYSMTTGADGKPAAKFFEEFPKMPGDRKVDLAFMQRGQQRFNIYCSACHGLDGYGHGSVNERALELQLEEHGSWVQAANLTIDPAKTRPVGHIFNTITNGIRNMPGYGAQIPVEDRWAIVAYVRALQLAPDVPNRLVSPEVIKQGDEQAKAAAPATQPAR